MPYETKYPWENHRIIVSKLYFTVLITIFSPEKYLRGHSKHLLASNSNFIVLMCSVLYSCDRKLSGNQIVSNGRVLTPAIGIS